MAEDPPLAEQFRAHFRGYGHLYGVLLDVLADDLDAGGVTADICRDHLRASRADVVHLRLLAGLQRIVLRGDVPDLAALFDHADEAPAPDVACRALEPVLTRWRTELHDALDHPPQTNEVGRSACLLLGIFEAVRRHGIRRVRLLEPGASAGLNLNVDRYRFTGSDWSFGAPESPLVLDTRAAGVRVEEFEIVSRRGCDLAPVDAAAIEGARYLTSFVWPFDRDRRARLAPALEIARRHPVTVDRAPAAVWLREQLAADPGDVLTVVWQSITRQYWPAAESAEVDEIVAAARERMALSHVTMEGVPPLNIEGGFRPELHGPQLCVDGDVIARSGFHGPPIFLVAG